MTKNEMINMILNDSEKFLTLINDSLDNRISRWIVEKEKYNAWDVIENKINNNIALTEKEFCILTGLSVTKHSDDSKMEGMFSISTNPFHNKFCINRIIHGIGICAKCFSVNFELLRTELFETTLLNSVVLTDKILDYNIIPKLDYTIFRFESFGDCQNIEQVVNYFQFCYKNPDVHFTIWTKNPLLFRLAINSGYKKPCNLTIILSSQNENEQDIKLYEQFKDVVDKLFTVFTFKYLKAHDLDYRFLNCGGRQCINCQRCYLNAKHSPVFINELLKFDIKKAKKEWGNCFNDSSENEKNHNSLVTKARKMFSKYENFKIENILK